MAHPRKASYVPVWCRSEMHKLSKADLMEIAYDYAMRSVGADAGEVAAYDELRNTAQVLARCADRKEPRIQRGPELLDEFRAQTNRRVPVAMTAAEADEIWPSSQGGTK